MKQFNLTESDIKTIINSGDTYAINMLDRYLTLPIYNWTARPDNKIAKDHQASFVNEKFNGVQVALGGTGCLGAEEAIYDPVTKDFKHIDQIKEPFHVIAWSGSEEVIALADKPYCKGVEDLYKVTLSNGECFTATLKHKVLTKEGYQEIGSLDLLKSCVSPPSTTLDIFPLKSSLSACHLKKTILSCQDGYLMGYHQCDAQLPLVVNICQFSSPSQDDAHEHIHDDLNMDVLGDTQEYIHSYPLSTPYSDVRKDENLHHSLLKVDRSDCYSTQQFCQHYDRTFHPLHTAYALNQYHVSLEAPPVINIVQIEFLRRDNFYDFTVPLFHNYLHKGIIHHNSGKSDASAYKVARFLLDTPPPRKLTPFLIVSESYDMVGQIWVEKLSKFIPKACVETTSWRVSARNYPTAIILKEDENGNSWVLDFRSYSQGRQQFQSISAGGFWCDEQVPFDTLMEIWARCRDYHFPGSMLYSLTPLSPDPQLESVFNDPKKQESWKFYRLNTLENKTLSPEWTRSYFENVPTDMMGTRMYGDFASFQGSVYKDFDPNIHVTKPFNIPHGWRHFRSIDFGFNHPTVCLWCARDLEGSWYVYHEYVGTNTSVDDHIESIKEIPWDYDDERYVTTYGDQAAAQTRAEFSKRGLPTASSKKDVMAGIESVKRYLKVRTNGKPKLYIFEHCKTLIKQMRTYRYYKSTNRGINPLAPQDKPVKKDDDAVDALRYLIHSEDAAITKPWQPPQQYKIQRDMFRH